MEYRYLGMIVVDKRLNMVRYLNAVSKTTGSQPSICILFESCLTLSEY